MELFRNFNRMSLNYMFAFIIINYRSREFKLIKLKVLEVKPKRESRVEALLLIYLVSKSFA